jgi:ribosomal protein L20A (L18A)
MDKSSLSRADKKELRKEVKSLKKEAATQGIYLSIGAIIIIILLLILLL